MKSDIQQAIETLQTRLRTLRVQASELELVIEQLKKQEPLVQAGTAPVQAKEEIRVTIYKILHGRTMTAREIFFKLKEAGLFPLNWSRGARLRNIAVVLSHNPSRFSKELVDGTWLYTTKEVGEK
jgi:hypothetical protein